MRSRLLLNCQSSNTSQHLSVLIFFPLTINLNLQIHARDTAFAPPLQSIFTVMLLIIFPLSFPTDKAAIHFSRAFYDALGAGRSYKDAFDWGCNSFDKTIKIWRCN